MVKTPIAKALCANSGNWVLAGLLAIALVWAYWAGHPSKNRPSGADEPFALWEVAPGEVTRITVHSAKRSLILEPEAAGEGTTPYIWIRTENVPPPPQAKPEAADSDGQPEEEKAAGPQFKGNHSAEQTFASLASLLVQRRIGKLDELENPLQYGLPADLEYVQLERKEGDTLRLNLGGSTYGDTYRYVQFSRDGVVYLLKQATVQNLIRSPIRMMDRDLFPFPTSSATRLDLRMGSGTVSFFRLTSSAADNPEWGASPEAEAGEAAVQAWMTELAKLKAQNYAGHDDPAGGNAALEATLTAEGHAPVTFKLLEQQDNNWIATSTHTRHPVRLNSKLADVLIESARPLLEAK